MPYSKNETPEMTKRMERCVQKVMAQGKMKGNAIAICKSSIMKGQSARKQIIKKIK